ncbi:hypothetical protein ACRPLG_02515 [Bacillus safensis]|uniref:hypothetical protein n=1 Tax=Bacillus safensis TaxID=561879 RepID=UPI003D77A65C
MTTQYKTEKRRALAGERILITGVKDTGSPYKNGDVYVVGASSVSSVYVGFSRGLRHEDYEVIVGYLPAPPNLHEMPFDELMALNKDVVEVLKTRYDQGRFDADIEAPKSDQQKRDETVAKAKEDVSALIRRYFTARTEFIVNTEKRTVVALRKSYRLGYVNERGIAKCAPNDCFNAHIGKAIALRRALGLEVPTEYLNVPQPTEVRVGDVINYRNAYILKVVDDDIQRTTKSVSTISISALQGSGGGYVIIDDSRTGESE